VATSEVMMSNFQRNGQQTSFATRRLDNF